MWIFDNESKELIIENPEYPFDPIHWSFKAHEQTGPNNVDSSLFAGNVPVHAEYTPPVTEGGFYKLEPNGDKYTLVFSKTNVSDDWLPIVDTENHVVVKFGTLEQAGDITAFRIDEGCILYDEYEGGFSCVDMFSGLRYVPEFDLTNLAAINVNCTDSMFTSCGAATVIKFGSLFDTSKVTSSKDLFYGAYSLVELDLSGWDGSSIQDTSRMFCGCTGLERLDISGWDFCELSGTAVEDMFQDCNNLKTIIMDYCDVGTIKAFLGYRYKDGTTTEHKYGYLAEGVGDTLIEHLSLKHCTINVEEEMWPTTERSVKARNLLTGCDYLQDVDLTDAVIKAGPEGETPGAEFDLTKCTNLDNDSYYAVAEALMTNPTLHAIPLPKVLVYSVYTPAQEVAQSKNWEWATS